MEKTIAHDLMSEHGNPLFVYDRTWLGQRAIDLINACEIAGALPRYAVKANPHEDIIKLFDNAGLSFDASSDYEAKNLIGQGVNPDKISLSSQQSPEDMKGILESGVCYVAVSRRQLDLVKQSRWQGNIAVRINPGVGSGHSKRTTTGGVGSSFGIWHEYIPEVLDWQEKSDININRIHVHVGAGVDPDIWRTVMQESLSIVERFPTVDTLDIGGGYKVARMEGEKETDLFEIMEVFAEELNNFKKKTGRTINLETEPGTWLVANSGKLLTTIDDIVDTGSEGYKYLKLKTGMNDILRPALYGAQHPIEILSDSTEFDEYVVVGHNCETGDILTPAPGEPEELAPRTLPKASIGDVAIIGGVGAYCGSSMSAHGYNSYPSAKEVVI